MYNGSADNREIVKISVGLLKVSDIGGTNTSNGSASNELDDIPWQHILYTVMGEISCNILLPIKLLVQ